ncbi:MAG: hypothetical protein ACRDRJ_51515, partial [Streptosporangiaceae bacterium]
VAPSAGTRRARAGVTRATLLAAQGTTVESGGVAPAVVSLTDAGTIAVDASLGNDFRVTIGGSRTMGNPANPTDGQKIVFQVTQGSAGSAAITWGSAYQFSTGLPQPTLSTTPGTTDLLAFVYNSGAGKWLMAASVIGFASTVVTPPKGTYRLFPSTNGPANPVSYSGSFLSGVLFEVTQGGCWLDGFWWWVCPAGQPTAAQKFALWAVYSDAVGAIISAATVTSGVLTAGMWNYVQLDSPVPLAPGVCYNACTGFTGGFPDTNNQYGSGDPYSGGIVTGPLSAFSDQSGSLPAPFSMPQGAFGVAGTDPSAAMPADGDSSSNFWMDLQVDTNAPAGASYRLWPSYPTLPGAGSVDTTAYTLANEFHLSASSTLDKIWFYSPSGSTALPNECGIWNVSTQAVVAGTANSSPSWSGAAGSGWVSCSYSGITLPAGEYKTAVFSSGGSKWYQVTAGYWGSGGAGASGITAGPITAPGLSSATSPGQGTYNPGSWAYPQSYGSGGNGENFWVDVEVTPAS